MPEAPPITITDPNDPQEPHDVLEVGPSHRVSERLVGVLAGVAVLVVTVLVVVVHVRADRDADRHAAVAFAAADVVGWTLPRDLPLAEGDDEVNPSAGKVITVTVPRAGVDPSLVFVDARLEGSGLVAADNDLHTTSGNGPFGVRGSIDCGAAKDGHLPRDVTLTVKVRPRSGRRHTVVRFFDDELLSPLVREACDLPDPDATTTALFQVFHHRLQVTVRPVPNAVDLTTVVGGIGRGLLLRVGPSVRVVLQRDGATALPVDVRVTDCAAARSTTSVALRVQDDHGEHLAEPDPQNPLDPRVATYLEELIRTACP